MSMVSTKKGTPLEGVLNVSPGWILRLIFSNIDILSCTCTTSNLDIIVVRNRKKGMLRGMSRRRGSNARAHYVNGRVTHLFVDAERWDTASLPYSERDSAQKPALLWLSSRTKIHNIKKQWYESF